MSVFRVVAFDLASLSDGTAALTLGHGTRAHGSLRRQAWSPDVTQTVSFSDRGYVSDSHEPFPPYVTDGFNLDRGLSLTADAMGGSHSAGSVTLANPGAVLDGLILSRINDHLPVRISTGKKVFDPVRGIETDPPLSDLRPVFHGLGRIWKPDLQSVSVDLLDATYWLDSTVNVPIYGGSGKLDGDSNVTGKQQPMMRGTVCNVTPVLIDSTNYVYQISDGPASVTALYEGGYAGGIVSQGTVEDIYAASPAAGHYTVQTGTTGTWLRLGTKPVYGITLDGVGQFRSGKAPSSVLDLLRQMLLEDLVMPEAYLDPAWPEAFPDMSWQGGWFWDGSGSQTGSAIVTTMLSGLGISLVPTRTGTLKPVALVAPTVTSEVVAEITAEVITSIKATDLDASLSPPTWRWRIGWQHNFTVQTTGSNLHPQASTDRQALIAQQDRTAVWYSSEVKSSWRVPNDPDAISTVLSRQADALEVANRHGALWGKARRLWVVSVPEDIAWGIDLGDWVGLTAPAVGLRDRVVGIVIYEEIRATEQVVTLQILV